MRRRIYEIQKDIDDRESPAFELEDKEFYECLTKQEAERLDDLRAELGDLYDEKADVLFFGEE